MPYKSAEGAGEKAGGELNQSSAGAEMRPMGRRMIPRTDPTEDQGMKEEEEASHLCALSGRMSVIIRRMMITVVKDWTRHARAVTRAVLLLHECIGIP